MHRFIAKVGKGQKTAKDLTWEEAKQAVRLLIEGQATPMQAGAFLVAMRFKMESVAELAAFTAAAREYVPPLPVPQGLRLVDFPTYAGKRETFHASVGAAIVATAAGASVLMHGHDVLADRPGTMPVLAKLGIPTELDGKQAAERLAAGGFAYLDLALYHPAVARFLALRQDLGVRNLFHPVAKMLNPARAKSQVVGVSHPPYFEKTIEALKMLGCPRALVLRGVEGDPELSLASTTKVLELQDERVIPLTLRARDLGMSPCSFREMAGFSREGLEKEAALLRHILRNEVRGGPRDWVLVNAAMLLYAAKMAPSISAAVSLATQALASGAASRKLEELASSHPQGSQPGGSLPRYTNPDRGSEEKPDASPREVLAS